MDGGIPEEEWDKAVWWAVDQAFSKPVTDNDDTGASVPTQVITEAFKAGGLDGVMYRSSFWGGRNVVLFDLEAAAVINCSLYEIKGVNLDFRVVHCS